MKLNKFTVLIILLITLIIGIPIIFLNFTPLPGNYANISKTNEKNIKSADVFSKEYISQLEESNSSSVNYLLFNSDHSQTSISFVFKKNIKNFGILKIDLFQDDTLITDKVIINDEKITENAITIVLTEYVSQFNKLRIYSQQNKVININVGQYYLEKYSFPNTPTSKLALNTYHTTDLGNSLEGDFEIIGNKQPVIEVYIPKKIKELNILKQNLILANYDTSNKYTYKYNFTIPEEYFSNNNLSTICFDTVFLNVDTVNNKNKSAIFTDNISLSANK